MLLKGSKTAKEAEWTMVPTSRKQPHNNDIFVLGDPTVRMPPIVSYSNRQGVKARLVVMKPSVRKGPPTSDTTNVEVIQEWDFTKDEEQKPIHFKDVLELDRPFWIEMKNPNKEDVVVNALIHSVIRSKNR